jgi:D-alanyl-D-alanine carboxypeptidase
VVRVSGRRLVAFVTVGVMATGACGTAATTSTTADPVAASTTEPEHARLPALPFGGELQGVLDLVLEADDARGASLAVLVPGYEPWVGVAGESEPGVPVTVGMAFGAGSISKSFIAALVLQLAEESRLSLDDQLNVWLPAYTNVDGAATIRQLLNHTSGLFQPNHHPDFWSAVFADGTRVWTDDEIISSFLAEPYSAKGTEWHYSNAGYMLLGQIIERATGSSVSAQLRERFFEPLQLTTAFLLTEETPRGEVAEGWFDVDFDAGSDLERFSEFPWTATMPEAGGVFASVEDLASWFRALFHDQTVLSPESLDQMLEWVPLEIEPERAQIVADYGLGAIRFNPELFDGTLVIGHSGGALFYGAAALYLPDYDVTIGAAQNTDSESFGPILAQAVAIVTSRLPPAP